MDKMKLYKIFTPNKCGYPSFTKPFGTRTLQGIRHITERLHNVKIVYIVFT